MLSMMNTLIQWKSSCVKKKHFFLIHLQQVIFSWPTGWLNTLKDKNLLWLYLSNTVHICVFIKSITAVRSILDIACMPHPFISCSSSWLFQLCKQNKLLCTSHPCNEDTRGCAFPIALYRAKRTRLTYQQLPKQTKGFYDSISLCLSLYCMFI